MRAEYKILYETLKYFPRKYFRLIAMFILCRKIEFCISCHAYYRIEHLVLVVMHTIE